MKIIPTINVGSREEFKELYQKLETVHNGIHFDFGDGTMSPVVTVQPEQLLPEESVGNVWHIMTLNIARYVEIAVVHQPKLVIMHAEADDFSQEMVNKFFDMDIDVGVAILPDTPLTKIKDIGHISELLIFGGHLGHNGGVAQLELLPRIEEARRYHPSVSVSWDGGVNASTIDEMKQAGLDIGYVGSAISGQDDPVLAYNQLQQQAS